MERALVVLVLAVAAAGVIAALSLGLFHAATYVHAVWHASRPRGPRPVTPFTVAQRIRRDRQQAWHRDPVPRCRGCGAAHHPWQACADSDDLQEPA